MPAYALHDVLAIPDTELLDWGPVAEPSGEPVSHTHGRLLHREPAGESESGVWQCTPGTWRCVVERNEFCHFVSGHSIYTEDSGEVLEVRGGDAAFFPAGWSGTCTVVETIRKTYLIS